MTVGMLWFDNDPKTDLAKKITRASEYYLKKYGKKPDRCYVHPTMLAGYNLRIEGIDIQTSRTVLPNHFWLGNEERL